MKGRNVISEMVNVKGLAPCRCSVNVKSHFLPPPPPLLETLLAVDSLWKLPEGDVDSLSSPLPDFVVSGSQGTGGKLPLGGWRGWWDDKD